MNENHKKFYINNIHVCLISKCKIILAKMRKKNFFLEKEILKKKWYFMLQYANYLSNFLFYIFIQIY